VKIEFMSGERIEGSKVLGLHVSGRNVPFGTICGWLEDTGWIRVCVIVNGHHEDRGWYPSYQMVIEEVE
jgi:hypothetical protein